MDLSRVRPRHLAVIGLLGLLPVVWYAVGRPSTSGYVAALNVVIMVAMLWFLLGPTADHDGGAETA